MFMRLRHFVFIPLSLTTLLILLTFNLWAKNYSFLEEKSEFKGKDVSIISSLKGLRSEIIIQFHIAGMETEDKNIAPIDNSFQKLKFNELNVTNIEGQPELPYRSVLVYGEPEDLKIRVKSYEGLSYQEITPYPSPHYPCRCDEKSLERERIDWNAYEERNEKFYAIEKVGVFRGLPVSRVSFYPAQYQGLEKGLRIYPRLMATLSHKNDESIAVFNERDLAKKDILLNNRYLILTPARFTDALKTFITWKKKLGFDVVVYTLEQVGSTFTQINDFLHRTYNDAQTNYSFALLVGDESILPTDYKSTRGEHRTPSDLSYFTMGGDDDYIPDVYAGRMVVSTSEDILHQTAKIIEYEKGLYPRMGGFARGIGIASANNDTPSDVSYIKSINDYFIKKYKTSFINYFEANSDAIPTNINQSLSDGAMWVTYMGHGSGTSWVSLYGGVGYKTSSIKSIIPGGVKPIVIDVACSNGRFIKGRFGERMMNEMNQNSPVGSVAYYGGTVPISWHEPAIMAQGIAKNVTEEHPRYLSQSLLAGQIHLANNWSDLRSVIDNFVWYHLLGDPSMIIRTTSPEKLDVKIDYEKNKMVLSGQAGLSVSGIEVVFSKGSIVVKGTSNNRGVVEIPEVGTGFSYAILNANFSYAEGVL